MIITGQPDVASAHTEVLDMGSTQKQCANLTDFPKILFHATGGLVVNKSIVCGGRDNAAGDPSNKCFVYQSDQNSFTQIIQMKKKREKASSITIQNKLWVTGGLDDSNTFNANLDSTEFIDILNSEGTEFIIHPGPNLPTAMSGHVLIALNNSYSMVVGGWQNEWETKSKKSWYFNWNLDEWYEGPELAIGRVDHVAGQVIDHTTNETHIIVATGFYKIESYLNSTEILFSGKSQWVEGV